MFNRKNSLISTIINIGDKNLKIAQSCVAKKQEITKLKAVPIDNKSDEEIVRILQESFSLKRRKVNQLGRTVLLLNRQSVTIQNIKLPSTNTSEIKDMIGLQAIKQLPYSIDDLVIGYQTLKITKDGYSEIILAIAHQDKVKRCIKILKESNIEVDEVYIDSQGICGWLKLQNIKSDIPLMVVDLDLEHARLDIVFNEMLIYSRAFLLSKEKEIYRERLIQEIEQSLAAFEKLDIADEPKEAVFTGAENPLDYINGEFLKDLPIKPLNLRQDKNIDLTSVPAEIKVNVIGKYSFASIFGLLLTANTPSFNLIPKDITFKKQTDTYRKLLQKTALISLLMIFSVFLGLRLIVIERENLAKNIKKELLLISKETSVIEKKSKILNFIERQLKQTNPCLIALTEVYKLIASDVALSYFSYVEDKPLILKGQAQSLSGVLNLVNTLETSDVFKDVQIKYSAKRKFKDQELAEFEIICPFERK